MNSDTTLTTRRRLPTRGSGRAAAAALAAATALLALAACSSSADGASDERTSAADPDEQTSDTTGKHTKPQRLLWMGDSIAEVEAPALGAAMKSAGVEFGSMAAAGGGGVVGKELAAGTWKDLPKKLKSFRPDVVAYQITTYDWGTPDEQRAAYARLAKTVEDAGAELLIVSAPPFKLDDFYKKHEAEIKTAPRSAAKVAAERPDTVHHLDATALWGAASTAAKAQRSKDGIHSCQQGSASFAKWFGEQLGKRYGFEPAPVDKWATGAWTGDKAYSRLGCA
ncbi:SGNH/GDSL hydrolase family protein [Streptomyces aureocirculatus]|uniref:SGNH/GDSL hydrolase family protein n=1 Tax=Streptomyces aureocirculatus TaxID=67275 RepID=UPI0004C9BEBD|nr:SGNH/GDSL hydrolase family protein [Streptomyces aureocirculatus]